jgi:prolyl 4-hydroxylase
MRYKIIDNFLSNNECEDIIEMTRARLQASTAWNVEKGISEITDYRKSEQTYCMIGENDIVKNIEQRIADFTSIPIENGEGLQIVRYINGGYYKPHWDYFDPDWSGNQSELNRGGQRIITFLIYLNSSKGGETFFPNVDMSVQPIAGRAICWSNVDRDGKIDTSTYHEATPVNEGEKWIATKWLRERAFR